MGMLDWLLGEVVEAPGIALNRDYAVRDNEIFDPASRDYKCTDFGEYLKKRQEIVDAAAKRIEDKYARAREEAEAVCKRHANRLASKQDALEKAKSEFVENRDLILAALRDAKQTALAKLLSEKMELWQ